MTVFVRKSRWGFIEYDIKFTFPDGTPFRERRKSPVSSESGTRKWAEKREAIKMAEGPPKPVGPTAPLLRDFYERWLRDYCTANRHKPSGVEHKRLMLKAHLIPHLGDMPLDAIGAKEVQEIKMRLADRAPKTVNNVLVVLSKMLRVAEQWGEIKKAPTVSLLRVEKKTRSFLSFESYNKLIEGAAKVSPACLALVLLAGDAGLRRGEIYALEWADIDIERRIIVVQRSRVGKHTGSTKGNAVRHVPMTTTLTRCLDALRRRGKVVLPGLTAASTRELIRSAEAAGGLPETGKIHVLRHTYASHAAMAGQSLYQLQAALGHQDHATTQGYAHLAPESLLRLADAVDSAREKSRGEIQERNRIEGRK